MFDAAPRWFLMISVIALISCLPLVVAIEKRLTVVETSMAIMEKSNKEHARRIVLVLDRLDDSVDRLAQSVAGLKAEVTNIKEK